MDGCERIRIRELFKSMINFVPPQNVCNKKMGKKYDQITYLLQVCYWIPLRLRLFILLFTRITLYYNFYRPDKGGGWRCIQALRSHFRNITSGLHFSSILQSSYPQFLQNLLFPLFLALVGQSLLRLSHNRQPFLLGVASTHRMQSDGHALTISKGLSA